MLIPRAFAHLTTCSDAALALCSTCDRRDCSRVIVSHRRFRIYASLWRCHGVSEGFRSSRGVQGDLSGVPVDVRGVLGGLMGFQGAHGSIRGSVEIL